MTALVERIIAARDRLKRLTLFADYEERQPIIEVRQVMAEAANTLTDLLAALNLAEDVLARFPFTSEIWPNGTHPNSGIEQIRAAIAKAETP